MTQNNELLTIEDYLKRFFEECRNIRGPRKYLLLKGNVSNRPKGLHFTLAKLAKGTCCDRLRLIHLLQNDTKEWTISID